MAAVSVWSAFKLAASLLLTPSAAAACNAKAMQPAFAPTRRLQVLARERMQVAELRDASPKPEHKMRDSAGRREFIDALLPRRLGASVSVVAAASVAGASALSVRPACAVSVPSVVVASDVSEATTLGSIKGALNELLGPPISIERMQTMDSTTGPHAGLEHLDHAGRLVLPRRLCLEPLQPEHRRSARLARRAYGDAGGFGL
jgi:hypothetical protein